MCRRACRITHLERFVGEEDELLVRGDAERGGAEVDVGRVGDEHPPPPPMQGRRRRQHDRAVLVHEHHFRVCNGTNARETSYIFGR